MSTFVPQLAEILRGMWRGRWMGLAVAWLAGLAGAALLFLTPDKYEATARVYVDTQSALKPLLQGLTVQPNVEQEVTILSRTHRLFDSRRLGAQATVKNFDVHPGRCGRSFARASKIFTSALPHTRENALNG